MNVLTQILDGYPFQMVLAANMFAFSFPKRERFWIRFLVHLLPMLLIYDFSLHSLPPVENYLLSRLMLMLPVTYTVLVFGFVTSAVPWMHSTVRQLPIRRKILYSICTGSPKSMLALKKGPCRRFRFR